MRLVTAFAIAVTLATAGLSAEQLAPKAKSPAGPRTAGSEKNLMGTLGIDGNPSTLVACVGGKFYNTHALGFATAGTRVLRGRDFTAADVSSAARVAIVNETMARTLWPNAGPIGECLLIDTLPCSSVVGVVEDARRFSLREKPAMQYYIPLGEEHAIGFGGRRMFVRPRGDASALRETLRAEMLRLNPGLAFVTVQPLQDSLDPQIRPWRLGATMFGLFGALALLVAAIGLYSVISYLVTQRRHELGVRIALGAQMGNIVGMVVRYGVGLAVVGIVIGMVLALNASRLIEPLLFETSPRNPLVFMLVAAVLLVVALVASVIPAWRASRVDPIEALRTE